MAPVINWLFNNRFTTKVVYLSLNNKLKHSLDSSLD